MFEIMSKSIPQAPRKMALVLFVAVLLGWHSSLPVSAQETGGIDPGTDEIDPLDLEEEISFKSYKALLISASHYRRGFAPLPNTNADMKRIAARLKVFRYDLIEVLSDNSLIAERLPVKHNIEQAIWKLAKEAKEDDMLLIVLSGHGVSLGGRSYYVPLDHASLLGLSVRNFASSCVALERVFEACSLSKAKKIMLVLDACRAESAARFGGSSDEFYRGIQKVPSNTLLLTSCGRGQVARILPLQPNDQTEKEPHSVFLHHFANGLEWADVYGGGNNGTLTASELCNYAIRQTQKFVRDATRQNQTPQIGGSLDSFPIGVYPNTNPYLKLNIPIDERMEVNLDRLLTSGNLMLQQTKPRINRLDLEARYWAEGTQGINPKPPGNIASIARMGGFNPQGMAIEAAGRIAGEKVLQKAKRVRALVHERVVNAVKEELTKDLIIDLNYTYNRYFKPDLKTRNSKRTHVYCADLFRSAYRYHQTLYHCKAADIDFELHVRLETPIYSEPDKKSDKLGTIESAVKEVDSQADEAPTAEAESTAEPEDTSSPTTEESAEDEEVVEADKIVDGIDLNKIRIIRVAVLEVQGNDLLTLGQADELQVNTGQWLKVRILDMDGELKEGWIEAKDAFWSPDLAEHYWVSAGAQSPRFRGLYGVVHAREMFIMRGLHIATIATSFAGSAGMYVGLASAAAHVARRHVYNRVPVYINARVKAAMKKYEEAGLEGWWSKIPNQK